MSAASRLPPLASRTFVDASAWVALFHRQDNQHGQARAVYERLVTEARPLVATNWTVYEALSILKSRAGPDAAGRFWRLVHNPRLASVARVSEAVEELAVALFFAHRDKTWGIVDCASLVVMEQVGCQQAFAFDHHFTEASRQRGFAVIP